MLAKKFKNLIKVGELAKDKLASHDNVYRLYTRRKTTEHRERNMEKTMELARELKEWAENEGAFPVEINNPDWCWVASENQRNHYDKLEFIPIRIPSPAKEILDKAIEKDTEDSPFGQYCVERSTVHLTTEMPEGLKVKNPDGSYKEGEMPDERLIGYFRADHDGYRWFYTWFDRENVKANVDETKKELEYVGTQLVYHGFLNGISSLREFVYKMKAVAVSSQGDEYNFYYSGWYCDYWVRFILRRRDYNMYIKCYQKEPLFHMKPEEIYEWVLAEKVEHLANTHHIPCEIYAKPEDGYVTVSAEITGDWKHSHVYMDELVKRELSPEKVEKMVTETTGTDFYTAIHQYFFPVKTNGETSDEA